MRLVADSGLWSTGPMVAPAPAVAVLELRGAVLAWATDDPSAAARIAFTDVLAAEWLWRVVGEAGHVAVLAALADRTPDAGEIVDVVGVQPLPDVLGPLRRLAVGHWLRRWWPASSRDGIVALDSAVLDGEIALLTAATQDYFGDETFDSDLAELLQRRSLSPVRRAATRASPNSSTRVQRARRRKRHRRAGGSGCATGGFRTPSRRLCVGRGTGIGADGSLGDRQRLRLGQLDGCAARFVRRGRRHRGLGHRDGWIDGGRGGPGGYRGTGRRHFGAAAIGSPQRHRRAGRRGARHAGTGRRGSRPVTETQAWDHDWPETTVTVGADVDASARPPRPGHGSGRSPGDRLARPGPDAFLAEILAAESDY